MSKKAKKKKYILYVKIDIESIWPPHVDDMLYQDMGYIGGSILSVKSLVLPLWNDIDDCVMRCVIISDMFTLHPLDSSAIGKSAAGLTLHITKSDLQQLDSKLYLIFRRII